MGRFKLVLSSVLLLSVFAAGNVSGWKARTVYGEGMEQWETIQTALKFMPIK